MNNIVSNRATNILYNFLKNIDNKIIFYIPSNICPIVPATFIKAEIKFKLIDVSLDNYEMDKNEVLNKIKLSNNIHGILWTNGYGREKSNEIFFKKIKFINKKNIIIDDQCLSIPKLTFKKTIADLVLFSTGYSKFIDLDHGGFGYLKTKIVENYEKYNNASYDSLIKEFRNSINKNKKININKIKKNWINFDYKINNKEYFNAISKKFDTVIKQKKILNNIYRENLPKEIIFADDYNNWRFNIKIKNKVILLKNIFKANLFVSSHYYPSNILFENKNMKNTDKIYKETINLFNDHRFDINQAFKLLDIINKHLKKYGI